MASGIRAALDVRGDTDDDVMAWAGDGGTFDIGLQALSGRRRAQRGHPLRLLRQRGVHEHRDPALVGHALGRLDHHHARRTTRSRPRRRTSWPSWPRTGIPYAATASTAYPVDLLDKVREGEVDPGHPVPPHPLALPARVEVRGRADHRAGADGRAEPRLPADGGGDGTRWRFTVESPGDPVAPYIRAQGRFRAPGRRLASRRSRRMWTPAGSTFSGWYAPATSVAGVPPVPLHSMSSNEGSGDGALSL